MFCQQPTPDLAQSIHVSRIMAGDPSRGAMSFDTEEEMKVGYWVVVRFSFIFETRAQVDSDRVICDEMIVPSSTNSIN